MFNGGECCGGSESAVGRGKTFWDLGEVAARINSSIVRHLRKDPEKVGMSQGNICGRAFSRREREFKSPMSSRSKTSTTIDSKEIVCLEQNEEERGRWGQS